MPGWCDPLTFGDLVVFSVGVPLVVWLVRVVWHLARPPGPGDI